MDADGTLRAAFLSFGLSFCVSLSSILLRRFVAYVYLVSLATQSLHPLYLSEMETSVAVVAY